MANLYTTGEFYDYYSLPRISSNMEQVITFETNASQIPASNWRSLGAEGYFDFLNLIMLQDTGLTGMLFFINDINATSDEQTGKFALNEEAIVLPQNIGDSVTGTLSWISFET